VLPGTVVTAAEQTAGKEAANPLMGLAPDHLGRLALTHTYRRQIAICLLSVSCEPLAKLTQAIVIP
jgi:hypothetical protein